VAREVGPDRVLAFGYATFVVAAGARSAAQLATHAGRAPLPYALSALAAAIYAIGLALLMRAHRRGAVRTAMAWCVLEFVAVIAVGTISVVRPFADESVWSRYGSGYGFVPLVLPLFALWWLRSRAAQRA